MTEAYDGRQVVGMDLHRRRSVLVRMTEDGQKLETVRIENSPQALRAVLARAGKNPRVVVEATYGWYWAVDVLEEGADRKDWLLRTIGVSATDPARYAWEPVAPGDPDHMDHARRLLHAVADRARWQAALNEARQRAALNTDSETSATRRAA